MITSFENMLDSRCTLISSQLASCKCFTTRRKLISPTWTTLWDWIFTSRRHGDTGVKSLTTSWLDWYLICSSFIKNSILIWNNWAEKCFQLKQCNGVKCWSNGCKILKRFIERIKVYFSNAFQLYLLPCCVCIELAWMMSFLDSRHRRKNVNDTRVSGLKKWKYYAEEKSSEFFWMTFMSWLKLWEVLKKNLIMLW